jgi:protein-S-isoprenylcysteine O-methyltransferase Ste14
MFILFRAIVYATLFIAFGLVFLPSWLLRDTGLTAPAVIGPPQAAGAVLVVAGGCLVAWSILTFVFVGKGTAAPFDPPRRLAVTGPFRYLRNPIYVGAVVAMAGAALYFRSWGLVAYAAAIAVTFHVLVLTYEEPVLRRTFGEEYGAYCARVRRWLPVWR